MSLDAMLWGAAAAVVLLLVWWLVGRPGWPRQRPPELPAPPSVSELDTPPRLDSLPDDEAAAARATETALREAQDSARRELAAREAAERASAERQATERAAAEREAQARRAAEQAEAAKRQAQAEAEAAQRLADAARRRAEQEAAAQREAQRLQAQRLEAQRQEALRLEAERAAAEHAAAEQAARERAAAEQATRERAAEEQAERERVAARQAAAAAAARAVPPPPPPARLAAQTLVMVADDSKVVRVKTSRLLATRQFQVVLAEDGEQALTLMAGQLPHLLITDVEMPGIDGLELTRRVRADARSAALPVIMITSADDRLRDEAQAAGVTLLMGKPYGDEQLLDQVARLTGVVAG